MKVKVAVVNAFVDGEEGGNPAGVVLDADNLSRKQKQKVAKNLGLSETAFVSESDTADFKLEFFTPQRQIAHCGHATIATFSHLSQLGRISSGDTSKETIDGNRRIEVLDDFAYMEQTKPEYQDLSNQADGIFEALGVYPEQILSDPFVVNTGNSFLVLGVRSIKDLESLSPDFTKIDEISEQYDLIGFYIYSLETNVEKRDASTRMFAPRYGIQEESATGMAAGPLACFLHDHANMDQEIFYIEQGYSMQPASPSCIKVVLDRDDNTILSLKAGGVGKPSRSLEIEID